MSLPGMGRSSAPRHPVPTTSVVSLEHPCLVLNPDKAIQMVGGSREISRSLDPDNDKPLGLNFQPDGSAPRTVVSLNKKTDNLLLKFTVPKRTGRKRKRGSDDPFVEPVTGLPSQKDVAYLLRSLRDNVDRHQTDVLGSITSTHVWRTMPDLMYTTRGSEFLQDVQAKILPQEYSLLKEWSLPETYALTDTEVIAPPALSTQALPFNYTYRQNPAVKTVSDPLTGKKSQLNTQAPIRLHTYQCQYDDEKWPDRPHPQCPPLSDYPESHKQLYDLIQRLFQERPLWTRRALVNQFPDDAPSFAASHMIPYVAFAIRSGPWKDTFCKFGVDPRRDRSFRKYQTVVMQLLLRGQGFDRTWARSQDRKSHIFTGKQPFPRDGKLWQLCDLEDLDLKPLVDTPEINIRHECDIRYFGWYSNGVMAKIRIALKAKSDALIANETLDQAAIKNFLTLPDSWDGMGMTDSSEQIRSSMGFLPKDASKKELEWAAAYRGLCRTLVGSLPTAGGSGKGRLSKSRPSARSSYIGSGEKRVSEAPGIPEGYEEPDEGDDGSLDGQEEVDYPSERKSSINEDDSVAVL